MFCQKCGVENKDNAAFCKSCGTQFNVKEELSADESWNAVNALTRWSIGIFLILIFVSNLAEENGIGIIGIIFGTIIGYYWLAPATVNLAREHNRNISWAYFIGFCICLLGFVIYWIYVTLTNDPQMLYGVQGEINEKMQDEPKK
jgi:uncharacterized membrane protein (DUF485 family)